MQYKKSDFVFFEFELSQIQDAEQGEVVEISTGFVNVSGRYLSDRCFSLSLKQIRISHLFRRISNEIHQYKTGLNYPDIHRKLVELWVKASSCIDNVPECNKILESLSDFKIKIIEANKSLRDVYIDGVKLYR